MADDNGLLGVVAAVAADVALSEAAKRKRWVRIFNAVGSIAMFALLAAVLYITFKYS